MAGALNDFTSTSKAKGPFRDTQYKATGRNRNALGKMGKMGKIVTMDKLYEATRGLHKIKKSIVEGMSVDMKGTLSSLCWSWTDNMVNVWYPDIVTPFVVTSQFVYEAQ
jgi:hypothetical protein